MKLIAKVYADNTDELVKKLRQVAEKLEKDNLFKSKIEINLEDQNESEFFGSGYDVEIAE